MLMGVPHIAADFLVGGEPMKTNLLAATAAVALLTAACGASIKATTDYDRNVNFANYQTFSIATGNSSGNPVSDQRIEADVTSTLAAKGWKEVPADQAQAAVLVHTATKTKHTYQTFYDGYGMGGWGWRRWGGLGGLGGGSTTYVNDYSVGSVVVDIFDSKTKEGIWHGYATDVLAGSAPENAKINQQAVAKMFASFPPGTTAATNGR
jgi:hypothetical protein